MKDHISQEVIDIEKYARTNSELAHQKSEQYFTNYLEDVGQESAYLLCISLLNEAFLFSANQLCRLLLSQDTKNIKLLHLLAGINKKAGFKGVAIDLLMDCLEVEPNLIKIRLELAYLLYEVGNYTTALKQAKILVNNDVTYIDSLTLKAMCHIKLGNFSDALSIYEQLLKIHSNRAQVNLRYGEVLRIIGRIDDAIIAFKQATLDKKTQAQAYWSLSNIKTYKFSEIEVEEIEGLLKNEGLLDSEKKYLYFTLGYIQEKQQNFENSFENIKQANNLNKVNSVYKSSETTRRFAEVKGFFTKKYFSELGLGSNDESPIFVLGLPRSGSTLVEQILSCHSQVDATMELTEISSMVVSLNSILVNGHSGNYPQILKKLAAVELENFGLEYLKRTQIYRGTAKHFIDKTPRNFEYIGLIKSVLPNAKIIDARRNPMATGFSIYKQFFASGFDFSHSLEDIGNYYNDYLDLMEHWNTTLPGQIYTVQYEDLVMNTEDQVRNILEFCGLNFEPDCLEFYKSKRAVATISSEQVRQPIYKSGLESWRNFEKYLEPLKQVLES